MSYTLVIFLPLLSALIVGLLGRTLGDKASQVISTGFMLIAAVMGAFVFYDVALNGHHFVLPLFTWIKTPTLHVDWAFKFDTLSAVMILVVSTVSSMVHLYSIGYMHHDPAVPRFMAYLSLFTFFMLMLVTATNLLQMFFGWEGVGLASYLLIGFWYEKDSANKASMKAFIANRVGDVSFVLGLLLIYLLTGHLNFDVIFGHLPTILQVEWPFFGTSISAVTVITLLLFGGAMGKSAQLGLHVWLPDAMEGPTPVSALIHAATMVTAGVFMMARMSPLIEYAETGLMVIACVGAVTAVFAGTVAITQFDIKRVIAYSTCSQLGYMFLAIGMSAYGAAVFHLFTHAFFKALLFLGAGSVIHALSDEQDMRNMGGVWRHIPITYGMMWIGTLALTGFPLLAGYYSKDAILESALATGTPLGVAGYWIGLGAAVLTGAYSWRLMFLTFHGTPRADERVMARVHESPLVMTFPLFVLALGAIFSGKATVSYFMGEQSFWRGALYVLPMHNVSEKIHHLATPYLLLPTVAGVLGFLIAFSLYVWKTEIPGKLQQSFRGFHDFLFNKWYFDELYQKLLIAPTWMLGEIFWKKGDQGIIDPYLPDGAAAAVFQASQQSSRVQTGYVFHYAIIMLVGIVLFSGWQIIRGLLSAYV